MTPTPYANKLWEHLHDEHGLTLTESELDDIIKLVPCQRADHVTEVKTAKLASKFGYKCVGHVMDSQKGRMFIIRGRATFHLADEWRNKFVDAIKGGG